MKQQFIISAVGPNITGIVGRISREIQLCGCNFEDSRMTVLRNHFALMILITGEGDNLPAELNAACERLGEKGDLSIALFPIESLDDYPTYPSQPNYELRVRGADRSGIVYRTSQLLAARNINITDMHTSIDIPSDNPSPIFTMKTRIAVPENTDSERLRQDLQSIAEDLHDVISLTRL